MSMAPGLASEGLYCSSSSPYKCDPQSLRGGDPSTQGPSRSLAEQELTKPPSLPTHCSDLLSRPDGRAAPDTKAVPLTVSLPARAPSQAHAEWAWPQNSGCASEGRWGVVREKMPQVLPGRIKPTHRVDPRVISALCTPCPQQVTWQPPPAPLPVPCTQHHCQPQSYPRAGS